MSSNPVKQKSDLLRELGWSDDLVKAFSDADRVTDISLSDDISETQLATVLDAASLELTLNDAPLESGRGLALTLSDD